MRGEGNKKVVGGRPVDGPCYATSRWIEWMVDACYATDAVSIFATTEKSFHCLCVGGLLLLV